MFFAGAKTHPKLQVTVKIKLVIPQICDFGCVAFSGVLWHPLSQGNTEHPKTQHTRRRRFSEQSIFWPGPLQKFVGDFCCINFKGFCRGLSWRGFLGTSSHKKKEEKKSGDNIREKSGGSKIKIHKNSVLPKTDTIILLRFRMCCVFACSFLVNLFLTN